MNKLVIYINIIFFLLFQTIASAEWITKKSNKYEKIESTKIDVDKKIILRKRQKWD